MQIALIEPLIKILNYKIITINDKDERELAI